MNKRTTIADVAAYLGINKSTVSRALNNPNRVSTELKERIEVACKELNYIPNVAAKTLASSSSKSIVLVVPSFTNSVFAEIISVVKAECDELGYNLLIGDATYTKFGEEKVVENFLSRNVDGFILSETEHTLDTKRMIDSANLPTVEIMDSIEKPNFNANFGVNQIEAAACLTEYLITKGRKNIAFCSTWLDRRAMLRKLAWENTLEKHGMESHRFFQTKETTSFHNGENAISAILSQWPETDAVFFVNDDMAAGAIMQCQRFDIKVGKDLDIVGFNDLDFAGVINPRLTTIRTPRTKMAKLAVKTLVDIIEGKQVTSLSKELPFELMIRESA
ncbi:LacI family DNA-binding transcriptional regulator [Vibrio rhizosphaerae]|uniref:LacI family DNA-binding transcriptional regulator n=1 Tax=Vibrio rhizosphaerae TaxID=398736 RepID=A0ABU4ITR3_9VIBR|nr:LacI family DNA-binding transcriptional regulator [Vibrio rhizosphaerae]MDW6092518.1 LacI family DNA-binding transcriptional regulator [Vibrio rhizosphaerae]